ncbi:MAG: hypothetical protein IJK23_07615 [Clostridia bacterium]|nr:hypothetical protein [Clostridia bacterium]
MKKSYIVTAVLILVAVCLVIAYVMRDNITGLFKKADPEGTTAPPPAEMGNDDYLSLLKGSVDNAEPIMKTDIDGVYYTMSKKGEVKFYSVKDMTISQLAESNAFDVTVVCTEQRIPAKVHCYTAPDGTITGYGLFTAASSDAEVYIYDYAFFKLTALPDSYAANDSYLLLVDTTKEDFYSNDKVYEENFRFNTKTGETGNILSTDNRGFDDVGAFRGDYTMLTDDAVKRCGENFLFFSARQYHLYSKDHTMDLYIAGGSGNNRDNNRYIQNVADFWFAFDSEGRVLALQKKGEGFALVAYDGKELTEVKNFDGGYENYIRSGDWLLNKETFEIVHLSDGSSRALKVNSAKKFTPDVFVTDGKTVFLRGVSDGVAAFAIGSVGGEARCFYNNIFAGVFSPMILKDGGVMMSVSADAQGSSYSIKIFNV